MAKDHSVPERLQETHHLVAEFDFDLPPALLGELLQVAAEHATINEGMYVGPAVSYMRSFIIAMPNEEEVPQA